MLATGALHHWLCKRLVPPPCTCLWVQQCGCRCELPRWVSLQQSCSKICTKIRGTNTVVTSFSNPRKTGWLYKHGGSGMSSHWRKRWFIVDHHYLFYYKGPNVRHRDFCWRCIVCVDGLECYFSWVFPPPVGIGIGCIYPLPPFSDFYKTNQFLSIVPIMCKTLINCRDSTKHLWRHNLIPPGKWPSSSTSGHVQR